MRYTFMKGVRSLLSHPLDKNVLIVLRKQNSALLSIWAKQAGKLIDNGNYLIGLLNRLSEGNYTENDILEEGSIPNMARQVDEDAGKLANLSAKVNEEAKVNNLSQPIPDMAPRLVAALIARSIGGQLPRAKAPGLAVGDVRAGKRMPADVLTIHLREPIRYVYNDTGLSSR